MRRSNLIGVFALASLAGVGMIATRGQNAPALAVERIVTGLSLPVCVTAPPGDTNRLFVIEQHRGRIRILDLNTKAVASEPFLKITGITTDSEQGLLGLAFHPNYASNGLLYVNYTTTGGGSAGHSEVVRFQAQGAPATATAVDPASKLVLLTYNQPEANHNGGWLGFGPDGYLYISTGDGGGANDQHGGVGNGQNLNVMLGKILRINVDQGSPYSIPDGNPFRDDATKKPEIWAFGMRNPWRCSMDRQTGDLWIGDVGQDAREEVDVIPAGASGLNFGWRPREGSIKNSAYPNESPITPRTDPVYDYGRGLGFCVIGGFVYRGQAISGLQGTYLFGDYGTARFWSFNYDGTNAVNFQERTAELNPASTKPISQLSTFGEDGAGELYLCDLADGEIYRIIAAVPAGIKLLGPTVAGNAFSFRFTADPGQGYVVESSSQLLSGAWQTLTNVPPAAAQADVLISDPIGGMEQFYRVRSP